MFWKIREGIYRLLVGKDLRLIQEILYQIQKQNPGKVIHLKKDFRSLARKISVSLGGEYIIESTYTIDDKLYDMRRRAIDLVDLGIVSYSRNNPDDRIFNIVLKSNIKRNNFFNDKYEEIAKRLISEYGQEGFITFA